MAVEENYLKNKILYKTQLCLLKVIPMVMAFIFWINTVLSYFDIDLEVFSYIGSCSIITIVYLYISSYVLRFCEYHRMFLHYVCIIWFINIYDYYIGIPVDDISMLMIYQIITGICLFTILYLYVKSYKKSTRKDNN